MPKKQAEGQLLTLFGLAWSENSDHNFNTLQKMRRELEQPFYCGLNIQTQFHSAGKNLTIRTKTIYYRRRTLFSLKIKKRSLLVNFCRCQIQAGLTIQTLISALLAHFFCL
jgi:hypothetical protein